MQSAVRRAAQTIKVRTRAGRNSKQRNVGARVEVRLLDRRVIGGIDHLKVARVNQRRQHDGDAVIIVPAGLRVGDRGQLHGAGRADIVDGEQAGALREIVVLVLDKDKGRVRAGDIGQRRRRGRQIAARTIVAERLAEAAQRGRLLVVVNQRAARGRVDQAEVGGRTDCVWKNERRSDENKGMQ